MESGKKRIGIYSGTFDPVHEGHLAFAHEAMEQAGLDKVFFLVEPRPRRKQGVKAFEHRFQMVQLSIKDEPNFGAIMLEQQRFTATDTLPILTERFKGAELYMLMGDDMLSHFADWPHVEKLMSSVQFVIGLRHLDAKEVRRRVDLVQRTRGLAMQYRQFQAPEPVYASSKIRAAIRRGQQPAGILPAVQAYIESERLYASGVES